jgi:hypothetical protein
MILVSDPGAPVPSRRPYAVGERDTGDHPVFGCGVELLLRIEACGKRT